MDISNWLELFGIVCLILVNPAAIILLVELRKKKTMSDAELFALWMKE